MDDHFDSCFPYIFLFWKRLYGKFVSDVGYLVFLLSSQEEVVWCCRSGNTCICNQICWFSSSDTLRSIYLHVLFIKDNRRSLGLYSQHNPFWGPKIRKL